MTISSYIQEEAMGEGKGSVRDGYRSLRAQLGTATEENPQFL